MNPNGDCTGKEIHFASGVEMNTSDTTSKMTAALALRRWFFSPTSRYYMIPTSQTPN
ncbi:hypothetical protein M378DRAFT_635046 [Amanita muscaria Koide BX008]|uniref:Uncharacterized protein n=1 Tax=Amanita muscaria (strain Koide BX008) TaxID=946122 RepID=A0A0C2TBJ6_AMAMK|nr:hypothetical protein M378DRAFT_635046 [Amanita muscaria Koide BX008]